ncbi:CpsD/CapB family tyrosine-protein kinase [Tunturibacter psychrotolerans]|uniref:CpsD/CapB family tyrosine-protein kinase n=1 Tax=Tunturiibacter psychrotolerans TaxID=3069686 RepID=A0AAU7ZND2_9BACT
MSRIFDALKRSEAERSGIDLSERSQAAEMMQRTERGIPPRWKTTVLSEHLDTPKSADRDALSGLPSKPHGETLSESSVAVELPQTEEQLNPFGQFRSLQVALGPQSRLVSLAESASPAAEAFRLLTVRLRHLRRDQTLKKVLITSTIPQEGKSMVAGNLACTLAVKTQQKILLLEGDLRRPSLSKMFGLGRNPGLCEWLEGESSLAASIYHLEEPDIWILPAGSAPSNALELLQSGRLSTLMDRLTAWFDWIIIDSPPVLPLADTSVWMRLADGILLATRQGSTEKRQLLRGLEAIERRKLIGALVNSSNNAATSDYYYSPATIPHK